MCVHAQGTARDAVVQRISQIKKPLKLTGPQTKAKAPAEMEERESSSMLVYLNDYPGNTVAI